MELFFNTLWRPCQTFPPVNASFPPFFPAFSTFPLKRQKSFFPFPLFFFFFPLRKPNPFLPFFFRLAVAASFSGSGTKSCGLFFSCLLLSTFFPLSTALSFWPRSLFFPSPQRLPLPHSLSGATIGSTFFPPFFPLFARRVPPSPALSNFFLQ